MTKTEIFDHLNNQLHKIWWINCLLSLIKSPYNPHIDSEYLKIMLVMQMHGCYCFIWDNMDVMSSHEISAMKCLLKFGLITTKNYWETQLGSYEYICALTPMGERYICGILQNDFNIMKKQQHQQYQKAVKAKRSEHNSISNLYIFIAFMVSLLSIIFGIILHTIWVPIPTILVTGIWSGMHKMYYADPKEPNYNRKQHHNDMFYTYNAQNSVERPESQSDMTLSNLDTESFNSIWAGALTYSTNADDTSGDMIEDRRIQILVHHFRQESTASRRSFAKLLYQSHKIYPRDTYGYFKHFISYGMF